MNKHKNVEGPINSGHQQELPSKTVTRQYSGREDRLFIAEHCSLYVTDHFSDLCKPCFSYNKGTCKLKLHWMNCTAICITFGDHILKNKSRRFR
jgi:hypothetical protein